MTEELKTCDFYNEKICALFSKYFGFNVECKNLFLSTIDCDIERECPIKRLEQENKELSFAIEKCLENAGIECDDEGQALRSLPMLGNAHYKVLVEKEALEQENKELKKQLSSTKCYLCGEGFLTPEGTELYEEKERYRSALEEIRENLVKLKTNDEDDFTYEYSKIEDEINEVLNEN